MRFRDVVAATRLVVGEHVGVKLAKEVWGSRDPHAIAGMAWVALNGLRGMIAPPKIPNIDGPNLAQRGLKYASNPTLLNEILYRTVGAESTAYTYLTHAVTFLEIGRFFAYVAHEIGLSRYFELYASTLADDDKRFEFAPEERHLQKRLLDAGRLFYCGWVVGIAKAAGWDVSYDEFLKILESDVLVGNHAAIRADFLATLAMLGIIPVAADNNFRNGAKQKKYGFGMFVDLLSLPLIHRDKSHPKKIARCLSEIATSAIDLGVVPLWFVTEGRTPEIRLKAPAGRNEKDFNFPGYFSNVIDPAHPREYAHMSGAVQNALDIMKKSGKPSRVGILTNDGAHHADPKRAKRFPFHNEIRTRQTITYTGAEGITVSPGDRRTKESMAAWSAELDRKIRDVMGTDQKLARLVGILGEEKGYQGLEHRFLELGAQDVAWFIIADRLRCVLESEFAPLCDRFLNMVRSEVPVSVETLDDLLKSVSDAVVAADPK